MRQARRDPALITKSAFSEIPKDKLENYNKTFAVFKTIRGTSSYYEQTKKNLMATLRQKSAPTLFFTLTSAEFHCHELFHQVLEHVLNKCLTKDEIDKMNISSTEKNKLISENVIVTTLFFEKRLQKIIAILKKRGFSRKNSQKQYVLSDYFYRIEFQQRGAPHAHLFFWLIDEDGNPAPNLWNSETIPLGFDKDDYVIDFHRQLISCSREPCCDNYLAKQHSKSECSDCKQLSDLVSKFQTHNCTFSCQKKRRILRIYPTEGLGKDEKDAQEPLVIKTCRYKFPRVPLDETVILYPMEKSKKRGKEYNKCRQDFFHIRKYLLRKIQNEKTFIMLQKMSFYQFLFDLDFFPDGASSWENEYQQIEAKKRYLDALRTDIEGSAIIIMQRSTADIFINNYSPSLMNILSSNMDIQLVLDPFAAASYITGYLTKNESGVSRLLKEIESNCKELPKLEKIKKFAHALDKNREVSIQEIIYRLLGLNMTKFSTKVKYLNTCHPHQRDGLLKSNLGDLDEDENVFHFSPHQYYEVRPVSMENWCLAEFWSKIEICHKNTKAAIKHSLLNDNGYIYERQTVAVLRYYLKYEDPEDLARALLILFYPFRDEMSEIHSSSVIDLLKDNLEAINERRKMFEKDVDIVSLIEDAENAKDSNDNNSENGEIEEKLVMEETTEEFQIDQFIEDAKSQALKTVKQVEETSPDINDLRSRINSLNNEQRRIFDDCLERVASMDKEEPAFHLYIAGEAGVGKSYILKLLIDAIKYIKMQSGDDDFSKPKVIVAAPTANAAFIINGKTIESALGINPKSIYNFSPLPPNRLTNLKFLYEDVDIIFIDEISMVGANKLAKINFQLQMLSNQEHQNSFMGGKS